MASSTTLSTRDCVIDTARVTEGSQDEDDVEAGSDDAVNGAALICIHGIGGADPDDVLDSRPRPVPVAGASRPGAGFFVGKLYGLPAYAYVWGGLTTGRRFPQRNERDDERQHIGFSGRGKDALKRASWILLFPFSLLNLAVPMVGPRSGVKSTPDGKNKFEKAASRSRFAFFGLGILMSAMSALAVLQLADYLMLAPWFERLFILGDWFPPAANVPIPTARCIVFILSAVTLLVLVGLASKAPQMLDVSASTSEDPLPSGLGRILDEKEASAWPHIATVLALMGAYVAFTLHAYNGVSSAQREITDLLDMLDLSWDRASFTALVLMYVALSVVILVLPGAWRDRTKDGGAQIGVAATLGMAPLLLIFEATLLATTVGTFVPVGGASAGAPATMALDNPLALLGGFVGGLAVASFQLWRVWPVNSGQISEAVKGYEGSMGSAHTERVLRAVSAAKQGANAHRIGIGVALGTLAGFLVELGFHFLPAGQSSWVFTVRSELVAPLVALLTLMGGLFVSFLWKSLRSSKARRSASLILDIVMFWPKAVHPWGVPWAGRRAVSDVSDRLAILTETHEVVLWAHSQGTVIAVAALGTLTPKQRARIVLITCGSPLRTLYSQHFPGYWNQQTTTELASDLKAWENYFRETDFVGRRVSWKGEGPKDTLLDDPRKEDAANGLRAPLVHSAYWTDPTILEQIQLLVNGSSTDASQRENRHAP